MEKENDTVWKEIDNKLHKTFVFKDFTQAFVFMTEVAFEVEKQAHHPNWSNVYNRVTFHLNTHEAGNVVTDKDRRLAQAIDQIFEKFSIA